MPVHLFGRPAPLAELAAFGLPLLEDAAQAFGAEGVATHGRRLHLQLLPDQEPVRARRRRPRRRAPTTRVAERIRMLRFHGSRRQEDVRADRDELAAGRAPGRVPPHLAAAPRRLERLAARRRRALRRARPRATPSSCPPTLPATSTTCIVVRTPERDRIAAALAEREIASAAYYVTPLHLQPALRLPRVGARLAAGDRAGRRRELRAAALGRDRRRGSRSASSTTVLDAVGVASARVRTPINRHRLPQLAADLAIVVAAWFFAFRLRFDTDLPVYYEHYVSWQILGLVAAIKLSRLRALRLLQPLVAVRLDAGHVGRGARRPGGEPRHLPRLQLLRRARRGCAAHGLGDRLRC